MTEFVEEYPEIVTEEFCQDLIDKIQEKPELKEIPKNHQDWKKIEHCLYKNLLSCVVDYKKKRLATHSLVSKELLEGLQQKMAMFSFQIIQNTTQVYHYNRYKSRYNLLTFVLYLNKVENGKLVFKNTVVEPETGKLVLFPETPELSYYGESPEVGKIQYIITGQITLLNEN